MTDDLGQWSLAYPIPLDLERLDSDYIDMPQSRRLRDGSREDVPPVRIFVYSSPVTGVVVGYRIVRLDIAQMELFNFPEEA